MEMVVRPRFKPDLSRFILYFNRQILKGVCIVLRERNTRKLLKGDGPVDFNGV